MIRVAGWASIFLSIFILGIVVGMELRYHDGKLSNMVEAIGVRLNYVFYGDES